MTGPRTIWLGPEAAELVAALPRVDGAERVFSDELTASETLRFLAPCPGGGRAAQPAFASVTDATLGPRRVS